MNFNYESLLNILALYAMGFVEAFMIAFVGSKILGRGISIGNLAVVALCQDVVIRNFRLLYTVVAIPFGTHLLFGLITMTLLIKWRARELAWSNAAATSVAGYVFLLMGTAIIWPIAVFLPEVLHTPLIGYLIEQLPLTAAALMLAFREWRRSGRESSLASPKTVQ